jgi:outer membrane receptor for ferrienterochelin and colicins
MWFKLSLLIAVLFMVLFVTMGQSPATIVINDAVTGEPIPYAQVLLRQVKSGNTWHGTSDVNGIVTSNISLPAEISVYQLGYQTYKDSLISNQGNIIKLQPRMFSMDDVVVTGQASPVKSDQSIYKVKLKNVLREDLKAASDMHQLLQMEPSIRLTNDMLLGSKIIMQGLPGQYVKVLVDGVPVTGRMDGNIDLSQIDLSNISHVEIVEGPLSVIYGSGALAGTINIITKEQTGAKSNVSASAYAESVDLARLQASVGLKRGNHGYGLNGSGYYFNGWSDTDTLFRAHIWKPKQRATMNGYYLYARNKMRLKYSSSIVSEKTYRKGRTNRCLSRQSIRHNFHHHSIR